MKNKLAIALACTLMTACGGGGGDSASTPAAQWCIDFGGGSRTCVRDEGVQLAATARGGLYLKGNQLFSLDTSGSTFVVGGIYTKK